MKHYARALSALFIVVLPLALLGAAGIPNLPASRQAVTILNPGTGDYLGFRIVVEPNGKVSAIDAAGRAVGYLSVAVTQTLFTDVASAAPLASLPASTCSATASNDTTIAVNAAITVSWNGQRSPLLLCATDPRAVKLVADATAIQRGLYVQAYRTRVGTMWSGASDGGVLVGSNARSVNLGGFGVSSGFNNAFGGAGFSNGSSFSNGQLNSGGAFSSGSFSNSGAFSSSGFGVGGSLSNGTFAASPSSGSVNSGSFSSGGAFTTGSFNANTSP